MPSFDSGYYAFTALIPLLPDDTDRSVWHWNSRSPSPVHSLRELLDSLRTVDVPDAGEEPAGPARPIPFSGCDRTHFARLVVVEDLAWNGREGSDTLLELLWGALGRSDRQTSDRLPCPYLLVVLDFDAPDGDSASVENYLNDLWPSLEQEWTLILRHCRGFDPDPQQRRQSCVELLLRHEIDSTFTYTGYGWAARQARHWDPATGRYRLPEAASLPPGLQLPILWVGLLLLVVLGPALVWLVNQLGPSLVGLLQLLPLRLPEGLAHWTPLPPPILGRWLLLLGGVLLLLPFVWTRFQGLAFQPWPAEPGTDLRSVLKALHLQRRFLELAEERQQQQGEACGPSLRRRFRAFLEETQPHDRDAPSLQPGSLQTLRRTPQP